MVVVSTHDAIEQEIPSQCELPRFPDVKRDCMGRSKELFYVRTTKVLATFEVAMARI